jgi:hypothetical protein
VLTLTDTSCKDSKVFVSKYDKTKNSNSSGILFIKHAIY